MENKRMENGRDWEIERMESGRIGALIATLGLFHERINGLDLFFRYISSNVLSSIWNELRLLKI
jgi:hypothetical protein